MCKRIMRSLDMFKSVHGAYQLKQGFDEHTTTRHSVPDPLADQLKGVWFCIREGLLKAKCNATKAPDCYPLESTGKPSGEVANCFLDVEEKGYNKIKHNFKAKL